MKMPRETKRTAIIAGNGLLPVKVAQSLQESGAAPFLLPIRGEADQVLYTYEHQEISALSFGLLVRSMRKAGVSRVILAGGIRNRPHISDLRMDIATLRALPRIFSAMGKGDDALLRAFIRLLEVYGFSVAGAHEVVPDLLAPSVEMVLTQAHANPKEKGNITLGAQAARMLGDLDVGQGGVAIGGRIVALEGAEGTDLMLERVAELRSSGRIPKHGGVLVKSAKPRQDERADLPAIGKMTVENVVKAGLSGIAIEAGRTFILEFGETVAEADRHGIFIETFARSEDQH